MQFSRHVRHESIKQALVPVFGQVNVTARGINGGRFMFEAPHIGQWHRAPPAASSLRWNLEYVAVLAVAPHNHIAFE